MSENLSFVVSPLNFSYNLYRAKNVHIVHLRVGDISVMLCHFPATLRVLLCLSECVLHSGILIASQPWLLKLYIKIRTKRQRNEHENQYLLTFNT